MKRFFIIATLFAATFTSFSQSLEYQDLGLLFSQNDHNGTARFTAMSGAFGALGGDISTININPAGLSVFNNSMFSGTFNSRSSEITASFGDANFNDRTTLTANNELFNLSHAGAVLVFDSAYTSDWNKFAVGFNYRITKDFSDNFSAEGNEAITRFDTNPRDTNTPKTLYNFTDGQLFETINGGELTEFNFGFSSVYQKKLHVGIGLNFYNLNFSQKSVLTELNSDVDGNILDVELYQENFTTGAGFSANFGFIYKALPNFRFGLSYQTPTWFSEILQDTNFNQDSEFDFGETTFFPENEAAFTEFNDLQLISYRLKTPSTLTASAAFIFGKNGLLSFDYINRNYQKIKLTNGGFTKENQFFQDHYKNTHNLNIGTEWRFDRFSVRGGYKFEQSPNDENAINTNTVLTFGDMNGYSFGAGYNFGNFKVDFAYSDNSRTANYNFYNGFANPSTAANLTLDNKIFTATVSLSL